MGKNQAVEKAEYFAESIGRMAYQALLEEVYTVPKPGLVDPYSCGAHTDMDVQTFERSAEALYPWFVRMAYQGYQLTCTPEDLFREIRKTGMLAEEAMYPLEYSVRQREDVSRKTERLLCNPSFGWSRR